MPLQKRRRPSVKEQIEKAAELRKRELIWAKRMGKSLRQVRVESSREGFVPGDLEGVRRFVNSFPKSHFFIHQHLPMGGEHTSNARVSYMDISGLSFLMAAKKAKTGVIVSTNRKGEDIGRTFYKIDKPITMQQRLSVVPFVMPCLAEVMSSKKIVKDPYALDQTIIKHLSQTGMKLKQRFVPMLGYKFNPKTGQFVKAKKGKPR